jgi:Fe-S-cluster-containing hydrogenase component 2
VANKCDLCGGKEPQCVKFCPAHVLKLQTPAKISQEKRTR